MLVLLPINHWQALLHLLIAKDRVEMIVRTQSPDFSGPTRKDAIQ
jgi:hypothetical protein